MNVNALKVWRFYLLDFQHGHAFYVHAIAAATLKPYVGVNTQRNLAHLREAWDSYSAGVPCNLDKLFAMTDHQLVAQAPRGLLGVLELEESLRAHRLLDDNSNPISDLYIKWIAKLPAAATTAGNDS